MMLFLIGLVFQNGVFTNTSLNEFSKEKNTL
jgi:hypothetical protein